MSTSEDLDARILDAEARLIERETRVREGLCALREQVSEAARPQRWLAPALGSMAALLVLRALLRKRHGDGEPASDDTSTQQQQEHHQPFPWVRLTTLLWPMLPDQWRARVPAPLVNLAIVAAPFLPLLSQHLARRRQRRRR